MAYLSNNPNDYKGADKTDFKSVGVRVVTMITWRSVNDAGRVAIITEELRTYPGTGDVYIFPWHIEDTDGKVIKDGMGTSYNLARECLLDNDPSFKGHYFTKVKHD